jgi:ribonuclease Z
LEPAKIVFSGDCRPSEGLIKYGMNCDILIHEATYDHSQLNLALKAKHSTVDEAIEVKNKMKAKWTILTHFSTRYNKIMNLDSIENDNLFISFDFMNVHMANLEECRNSLFYLKYIFQREINENEMLKKTNKAVAV